MKYIRAKDKIEKAPNDYANKLVECPNLKIADTIEELCDEFVDIYEYEKPSTALLTDIMFFESYKNHTVYGAIWTDKGLIYVAKMNDKGELELLWAIYMKFELYDISTTTERIYFDKILKKYGY